MIYDILCTIIYDILCTMIYDILCTIIYDILCTMIYDILCTIIYDILCTIIYDILCTIISVHCIRARPSGVIPISFLVNHLIFILKYKMIVESMTFNILTTVNLLYPLFLHIYYRTCL
jgi:hypothetical protein